MRYSQFGWDGWVFIRYKKINQTLQVGVYSTLIIQTLHYVPEHSKEWTQSRPTECKTTTKSDDNAASVPSTTGGAGPSTTTCAEEAEEITCRAASAGTVIIVVAAATEPFRSFEAGGLAGAGGTGLHPFRGVDGVEGVFDAFAE